MTSVFLKKQILEGIEIEDEFIYELVARLDDIIERHGFEVWATTMFVLEESSIYAWVPTEIRIPSPELQELFLIDFAEFYER